MTTPAKSGAPAYYRNKPVVIQAMQYTEETRDAVIQWCGAGHIGIDNDGAEYETAQLRIATLEGTMHASLGDWIVKGVHGEFYPVKPDIFAETKEPVGAERSAPPGAPDALRALAAVLGRYPMLRLGQAVVNALPERFGNDPGNIRDEELAARLWAQVGAADLRAAVKTKSKAPKRKRKAR